MVFVIDNVKLDDHPAFIFIYKYKYIYVKMKTLNIFSLVAEYDNAKSRGVLNKPNVSFVDEDSSVRYLIDLTHNGYEYVDLGLPSGLKWATCNVGASSPEQTGLYFAWGETTGYTAEQVKSGVRQFDFASYKATGISADLMLEQDAAHVNLGGNWRMPTKTECQELIDNCDSMWTDDYNGTGVKGGIFTSNVNGNSVFFPASGKAADRRMDGVGKRGVYWSASLIEVPNVWQLFFNSSTQSMSSSIGKYGCSVRGVFK